MRPINPGRSARGKRAYTETHVNSDGAVRVANIGANNAVTQNLQLDADEFDAVVADLIRRGAGDGTKIAGALSKRGIFPPAPHEDESPELAVPRVLAQAQRLIFASQENLNAFVSQIGEENFRRILDLVAEDAPEGARTFKAMAEAQTKIEELERQLADIKEGQARTTADAEADEDEETYFKRIVESIAETPSYLAMLNDALADRGMRTTGPAAEGNAGDGNAGDGDAPSSPGVIGTGLLALPAEQVQVDLTALDDGGQQIAIRISPDGEPADQLIARYLDLCKDRGIPIKRRKQRAAPAKKSNSG